MINNAFVAKFNIVMILIELNYPENSIECYTYMNVQIDIDFGSILNRTVNVFQMSQVINYGRLSSYPPQDIMDRP